MGTMEMIPTLMIVTLAIAVLVIAWLLIRHRKRHGAHPMKGERERNVGAALDEKDRIDR